MGEGAGSFFRQAMVRDRALAAAAATTSKATSAAMATATSRRGSGGGGQQSSPSAESSFLGGRVRFVRFQVAALPRDAVVVDFGLAAIAVAGEPSADDGALGIVSLEDESDALQLSPLPQPPRLSRL